MLRPVRPGAEAQAYVAGKLVPSNLCEVIKDDSSWSWLSLYASFSKKIKRRFCKLYAPRNHIEIDHTCLSTGFSGSGTCRLTEHVPKILRSAAYLNQLLSPASYLFFTPNGDIRHVYSPLIYSIISRKFHARFCHLAKY
jgi:hypothetical protein